MGAHRMRLLPALRSTKAMLPGSIERLGPYFRSIWRPSELIVRTAQEFELAIHLGSQTYPSLEAVFPFQILTFHSRGTRFDSWADRAQCVDLPFIIVSATSGEEVVVEAMMAGTQDERPSKARVQEVP